MVRDSKNLVKLNYAILIPTYNNAPTLARVLKGVLSYTQEVWVVNDGATDHTAQVLSEFPQVRVITLPKNQGKGNALKIGFRTLLAQGYDYALTIDSDGQHFPEDIPTFLRVLEGRTEPVLLVGSRDMTGESVPKKSSFGNRFSNFWFHLETGIRLPDTQSGYRLYPLSQLPKRYFSGKFEFEIEVLVRTAWRGVAVENVPVRVLYDPAERVSHFRPLRDFMRISLLNTCLVLIAFLYIKPRNFFRKFKKKSFSQFLREDLLESNASHSNKACSVALGLFFGIAPFWGFQTLITLSLAALLGLNKSLAFLCSNISIPPMIPFLGLASLKLGSLFVGGDILPSEGKITQEFLMNNLSQYLVGSFLLASLTSALLGSMTYLFLKFSSKQRSESSER